MGANLEEDGGRFNVEHLVIVDWVVTETANDAVGDGLIVR